MPSTLFGLTGSDLQAKLVPSNAEFTFEVGVGKDLEEDRAVDILNMAEDLVLMRLPQRYQSLLTYVEGEVLTSHASEGQTALQCGLFPVTDGTLKLYVDFPLNSVGWDARDDSLALDAAEFSLAADTGVITLTKGLSKGRCVVAEYAHTGAREALGLREAALTLAAVEVSRQFAFFSSVDGVERFTDWENTTFQSLNRLQSVPVLDKLRLIHETGPGDRGFYRMVGQLGTAPADHYDIYRKR